MKEIEKKFIENLNAFNFTTKHEAVANFSNLEKHKELFQSKYEMEEVSDAFSKIVRQIYERLTRV